MLVKKYNNLIIHDADNYKIISLYFNKDTCTNFSITYYNFNKEYVEKILNKKYNYNESKNWTYKVENKLLELCFNEVGGIFILEACHSFAENDTKRK